MELVDTSIVMQGGNMHKAVIIFPSRTGPPGTHRYVFKLFALDTKLALPEGMRKEDVLAKMKGHVMATAELAGTYTRR